MRVVVPVSVVKDHDNTIGHDDEDRDVVEPWVFYDGASCGFYQMVAFKY